jgi:hypothetical protein
MTDPKSTQDQDDHDSVLAAYRQMAREAKTPSEAFRVAILAVHYSRVMHDAVNTAYAGKRHARRLLEDVAGQKLGDPTDAEIMEAFGDAG